MLISPKPKRSIIKQLFPIKKGEGKKVFVLCLYKAIASFVFASLKPLKEAIIANTINPDTNKPASASVIGAIKGIWGIVLMSLFIAIYAVLVNRYPPKKIFYGFIAIFAGFLFLYVFVLFPYADALRSTKARNFVLWLGLPKGWDMAFEYWMHSLFFVMAEIWAQATIVIFFFSITNELFTYEQAKRVYHIIITGGYLGGLLGAQYFISMLHRFYEEDGKEATFKTGDVGKEGVIYVLYGSLVAVFALTLFYSFLDRYFLQGQNSKVTKVHDNGKKVSLAESIRYIFRNHHLLAVLGMVFFANLSTSLIDLSYVALLKQYCGGKTIKYALFSAYVLKWSIVASIITGFLGSAPLIKRFGWKASAYVMPVIVLISGSVLWCTIYMKDSPLLPIAYFGCSSNIHFIVLLAASQHILWKVAKYIFFDATREMAYINMDVHSRRKGKAGIDVLGSRVGKSSSSWLQGLAGKCLDAKLSGATILLFLPWFSVAFVLSCIPWFISVHRLGKCVEKPLKREAQKIIPVDIEKEDSGENPSPLKAI